MRNVKYNLGIACAIAFASLVLSMPSFADGTISVKCTDQAGAAVSGAKIFLQHFQSGKVKDKKSDAKGIADFGKVDDGTYRIVGRKDGYAPALYEFVQLAAGGQQSVTLGFQPGDTNTKLYFEDPAVNSKAHETLNLALNSLRENKVADGEKQLKASLELNPSNPFANFYLAIVYLQEKKWDLAEETLKKASFDAGVMMQLPAKDPTAPNPWTDIKSKADEQLVKLPSFRLREEGEKAFNQKKYDVAIAKFQEALKNDPKDSELHSYLAVSYANLKKFDEAMQEIEKALQMSPTEKSFAATKEKIGNMREMDLISRAQTILTEGDNFMKSQDYAQALKKYEEALPLLSGARQAVAYAAVARAHAGLNDSDQAIAAYKKAMELAPPDKPEYRNALANYYMKLKRDNDALDILSETKGEGGEAPDVALFQLGKKQSDQGNSDFAALAFERSIKANPANAEAYYELGMLRFYEKKNDAQAKELLEKYVQIGKNNDHLNNTNNVLVVLKRRMAAK
jgi:tetratricopeptide (TPR) repeat protein